MVYAQLSVSQQKFVNQYFKSNILPIISPIIVGSHHPAPHLVNKSLYAAALLKDKKGRSAIGIVPIPETLPAYVRIPDTDIRYIRTENIVLRWAPTLFGTYQVMESCIVSVTRNADISFDDEKFAKGPEGYICIKANSVTEREVIEKLKEASQAGVEVQLIIRGICCILPGVPKYTDHIHVTSIVGRFLEHARIYCFGRDQEAKLYLSSADFMTRNLNRRVEITCPIHDSEIREQLKWVLSFQMEDNMKASFMMPDGLYSRKLSLSPISADSQLQFMNLSLHKAAQFVPVQPKLMGRIASFLPWVLRRT